VLQITDVVIGDYRNFIHSLFGELADF